MSRFMDEEEISEYRDCFNLFDKSKSGKLNCTEIVSVMRALGTTPTVLEINKELKKIGKNPAKDTVDFSQFLNLIHSHKSNDEPQIEILKAFQAMDVGNTGKVNATDLKRYLMNVGEKLTSTEVDKMYRVAKISPNQMIKYKDFIRIITIPVPEY